MHMPVAYIRILDLGPDHILIRVQLYYVLEYLYIIVQENNINFDAPSKRYCILEPWMVLMVRICVIVKI